MGGAGVVALPGAEQIVEHVEYMSYDKVMLNKWVLEIDCTQMRVILPLSFSSKIYLGALSAVS